MSEQILDDFKDENIKDGSDIEYKVEFLDDWDSLELPEKPIKRYPKKILQCKYCSYTTVYRNSHKYHIMKHNNAMPFACDKCSYRTVTSRHLNRHILCKHTVVEKGIENIPTFQCPDCSYKSIDKDRLSTHRKKHSNERYQCDLCDYSSPYKYRVKKHVKVHFKKKVKKEETTYKCDLCPFITKSKGYILGHLVRVHNAVPETAFKCDMCKFVTNMKCRLEKHVKISLQKNVIQCEQCEFTSSYKCEYSTHRLTHLGDVKMKRKLDVTSKTCVGNETDNNIKILNTGNSKQCEELTEINKLSDPNLKYDKQLRYVIDTKKLVHRKSIPVLEETSLERRFYHCTRCDYQSEYKASVQHHFERRHTDTKIKPFKCLKCNFTTKTIDQIALHTRRSKSELLINCKHCSFSTYHRCQLKMHEKQTHFQFKCSLCDHSCLTARSIDLHYKKHHENGAMTCKFCDYRTTDNDKLIFHESLHTGNKPFKCDQCDYSCVRNSLLVIHMRRHVNNDPVYITESHFDKLKV